MVHLLTLQDSSRYCVRWKNSNIGGDKASSTGFSVENVARSGRISCVISWDSIGPRCGGWTAKGRVAMDEWTRQRTC